MNIVYFSSKTGNTKRFAERFNLPKLRIERGLLVNEDYILFCPTYATTDGLHAVPAPVIRFLNVDENRQYLKGVVGFGNRNFGKYFAVASDIIGNKCQIPVLGKVELFGTSHEYNYIKEQIFNEYKI